MDHTSFTIIKSTQYVQSSTRNKYPRSSKVKTDTSIQGRKTTRADPFSSKLLAPTQNNSQNPNLDSPIWQSTKDGFTSSSLLSFPGKPNSFLPRQNPLLQLHIFQWVKSELSFFLGSNLPQERDPLCSLRDSPAVLTASSWTRLKWRKTQAEEGKKANSRIQETSMFPTFLWHTETHCLTSSNALTHTCIPETNVKKQHLPLLSTMFSPILFHFF